MKPKNLTKVIWINRHGEPREHSLYKCTLAYARNWFRESIMESQGILSEDERRANQLRLVEIQNYIND